MYCWRGKVGFLAPSRGDTFTYEFYKVVPDGIMLTTYCFNLKDLVTDELERVLGAMVEGARALARDGVDVMVGGGQPPVALKGPDGDRILAEAIREVTDVPFMANARCEIEAMKAVGIRNVALATPHVEDVNARLKTYLEGNGINVVAMKGLGILSPYKMTYVPKHEVYRLAKQVLAEAPDADGIHFTCPRWATLNVIPDLESDTGKPVTSCSQATTWASLKMLGIKKPISGFGSLFETLGR